MKQHWSHLALQNLKFDYWQWCLNCCEVKKFTRISISLEENSLEIVTDRIAASETNSQPDKLKKSI